MTTTIDFIFDFASPNGYLAYKALAGVTARTGAQVNIIPCLLGGIFKATGNQAPMMAFAGIKGKLDYDMLEMKRFQKKYDLDAFSMNPHFPLNTLLMMRGAIVAQRDGYLHDYIEAGLRHVWEDGLKMDDPDVFVDAMTKAGFDGDALLAGTQDQAVKSALIDNTNHAVERGAFGIPTFFVGNEIFFGKDRLQAVEDEITARA